MKNLSFFILNYVGVGEEVCGTWGKIGLNKWDQDTLALVIP